MARLDVQRVTRVTVKTYDFPAQNLLASFRTIDLCIEGEDGEDTVVLFTKNMNLTLTEEKGEANG